MWVKVIETNKLGFLLGDYFLTLDFPPKHQATE